MQIISFMAHKGGVGKTTLTFQMAKYLQRKGKITLLIDMDSQKNLTSIFENKKFHFPINYTIASILDKPTIPFKTISIPSEKNIDIIPSVTTLDDTLGHISDNREYRLRQWLKRNQSKLLKKYDFILIDLPPAWNLAAKNAAVASSKIISPMDPSLGGFQSRGKTIKALDDLRQKLVNPDTGKPYVRGTVYFLPNKIQHNTASSRKFLEDLKNDEDVFAKIPQRELLNKSTLYRQGAREYALNHNDKRQEKFLRELDKVFNKIQTIK